jgi:hypothetical protein
MNTIIEWKTKNTIPSEYQKIPYHQKIPYGQNIRKYHTVRISENTILSEYQKIIDTRAKLIPLTHIYIHDCSCLGTGTSTKYWLPSTGWRLCQRSRRWLCEDIYHLIMCLLDIYCFSEVLCLLDIYCFSEVLCLLDIYCFSEVLCLFYITLALGWNTNIKYIPIIILLFVLPYFSY